MKSQTVSRRDFKTGCGAAISAAFACSGAGVLATHTPSVPYIETRMGGALE
jgi:hypothetical protein